MMADSAFIGARLLRKVRGLKNWKVHLKDFWKARITMQRLIDESQLQCTLALIPMEQRTFRKAVETAEEASTVLTIPDNPTNGDMIKALYPQYEIAIDDILGTVTLFVIENGSAWLLNYDLDWWNSPYKADVEPDEK